MTGGTPAAILYEKAVVGFFARSGTPMGKGGVGVEKNLCSGLGQAGVCFLQPEFYLMN